MTGNPSLQKAPFWTLVWGLGLAGQLCWNIENQWFNTFVYAKIAKDSNIVAIMVITSALVTTLSTFFFGTLSDRRGNRRRFIALGYILWGFLTIAFGFTEFIAQGTLGGGVKLGLFAAIMVVVMDDLMSIFGSMGNDSGYNAWTNDHTTDQNRGQIGAILATQPVIGTIVGTIVGGLLIGSHDNYQRLFWVMGLFVISMGILSLIFLKDAPHLKPHIDATFKNQLTGIFRLDTLMANKELLLVCITTTMYFIPFNIYFVQMGNWMIYYMGFTPDAMGLIQGVSLILAMAVSIPAMGLINQNKSPQIAGLAILLNILGLWILYLLVRPEKVNTQVLLSLANLPMVLAILLAGAGFILMTQTMTMWTKQLYPEKARGQFEGVRVLFFTLIPMIIGTTLSNLIVKNGAGTQLNEYGILENIPTESIYLWAALLVMFAYIPLYKATKAYYKRIG